MLWDTAGQEEFDCITKAYYRSKIKQIQGDLNNYLFKFISEELTLIIYFRGAHCCLLSFSTTDRASFLHVNEWKKKVSRL